MPKKRKDGRYQKKITLSDGRQKMVYGRTLAELNAAADAVRAEDQQGVRVGDNTLVGEWAKIWIDKYKGSLRPNTRKMYQDAYNNHIMEYIGALPLREVRPVHIREIMSQVAGMSESLQHKVLITLHQISGRTDCSQKTLQTALKSRHTPSQIKTSIFPRSR